MRVMQLDAPKTPLREASRPEPHMGPSDILIRVEACGVCRTDLHVVDGELTEPRLPIVPGHEIVGVVVEAGKQVESVAVGDRVGVPWLGWTCGSCRFCKSGRENLCDAARFTGYQIDGGYAEQTVADSRYCFKLPTDQPAASLAPWMCAGLIGYRSLAMTGEAERLGLYGFGAAAHIVAQVARHQGRRVFAFTRPGDREAQTFALRLGAVWSGDSVRPRRRPHPASARGSVSRRNRGLRRNPQQRHPVVPVQTAVGRAHAPLRGKPHPSRRLGIPGPRANDPDPLRSRNLSFVRSQHGSRSPPLRPHPRGGRAGAEHLERMKKPPPCELALVAHDVSRGFQQRAKGLGGLALKFQVIEGFQEHDPSEQRQAVTPFSPLSLASWETVLGISRRNRDFIQLQVFAVPLFTVAGAASRPLRSTLTRRPRKHKRQPRS